MSTGIKVPLQKCKIIKEQLEKHGALDKTLRIKQIDPDTAVIPILLDKFNKLNFKIEGTVVSETASAPKTEYVPRKRILNALRTLLDHHWTAELENEVPKHWEKHGDLVMLSYPCFASEIWKKFEPTIWNILCNILRCERVARKREITTNGFRQPQVELLRGTNGWVTHIDNGIKYTFDVTKCMFSKGNISEKIRIAGFDCTGETVVDLYAGIGYFVLPFLVHSKAAFVHACEWNFDAYQALEKNLVLNGVRNRCQIHFGDNRQVCPRNVADRVNLGLIPSSEEGWEMACQALKKLTGGILHVHGNCEVKEKREKEDVWAEWGYNVSKKISRLLHRVHCEFNWKVNLVNLNCIKSYGPLIYHLVVDIKCQPVSK